LTLVEQAHLRGSGPARVVAAQCCRFVAMSRASCRASALALLLLPLATAAAQQGVPRVLLDRELNERHVLLVGLDDRHATYMDSAELLRTLPVDRLLAVTSPPGVISAVVPATEKRSVLELVDGQRIVGSLVTGPGEVSPGEEVRWSHPQLGAMEFKLDDIRSIALDGSVAWNPGGATGDLVILQNGDRLEGFVEGIGSAVLIDSGGQIRELSMDVIAQVVLANPAQPLRGRAVWLRDGSIIACRAMPAAAAGQIAIVPALAGGERPGSESAAATLPLDDVLAVAFAADRLAPLAAMEVVREEPWHGRRWSPPVRRSEPGLALLNAPSLEFPGPVTADWVLPPHAAIFASEAELPRAMWNWGDCILTVSLVGGRGEVGGEGVIELFRSRIHPENALVRLHLPLRAAAERLGSEGDLRLRISIDPGNHGPIQDQIILHRPLIVLEPQPD
jgi:hypothetical protein